MSRKRSDFYCISLERTQKGPLGRRARAPTSSFDTASTWALSHRATVYCIPQSVITRGSPCGCITIAASATSRTVTRSSDVSRTPSPEQNTRPDRGGGPRTTHPHSNSLDPPPLASSNDCGDLDAGLDAEVRWSNSDVISAVNLSAAAILYNSAGEEVEIVEVTRHTRHH